MLECGSGELEISDFAWSGQSADFRYYCYCSKFEIGLLALDA
jgi:hypothetical protein